MRKKKKKKRYVGVKDAESIEKSFKENRISPTFEKTSFPIIILKRK